jgi:alpha-galactosidase
VKYKDSQKDAYPLIREKALEYYKNYIIDFEKMNEQSTTPGAERGIFLKLFETYNHLPITTDSHLGEYLPWAHSIADHYAILEFYKNYKVNCQTVYRSEKMHSFYFDQKRHSKERLVDLMEAIIEDRNMEEAAVNIKNNGYIKQIPNDIVVEVPAMVNKKGIEGIKLENYPDNFASILVNQVGTIRLTTTAVLEKSKEAAFQALLADPVVDNFGQAEKLLDTMITFQNEHLGYLK